MSDLPLMEQLRNLEKGYDRKFALSFMADEVWAALEERFNAQACDDRDCCMGGPHIHWNEWWMREHPKHPA